MTKIYVLTEGEYSDYGVVGVFSSIELCESVKNKNPEATCEVYELDALVERQYCKQFVTAIDKQSGDIIETRQFAHVCLVHPTKAEVEEDGIVWHKDVRRTPDGPNAIVHSWDIVERPHIVVKSPISMEHAIKVAIESRQKWLREKAHVAQEGIL